MKDRSKVEPALLLLRTALYLQLVSGLVRMFNLIDTGAFATVHIILGILVAVLAIVRLRPLTGVPNDLVRSMARFAPSALLAMGLLMLFGAYGLAMNIVHALLGIAVIGLIEMASVREMRARRRLPENKAGEPMQLLSST